MDGLVRARTGGRERMVSVPLEWGKFRGYEWVLNHRLVPLLDEKNADGKKKRPSLKKFVLATAWWDTCWTDGDPPVFNLPSRAWTFSDFFGDVLDNGVTNHNRNYPTAIFGELFHGSILVSDRGQHHLPEELRERVRPLTPEAKQQDFDERLKGWQKLISRAKLNIGHPDELASAERMLKWAQDRGYDVTLLAYPLMPVTIEEKSRVEVLVPFADSMRQLAARRGVRFVDATFDAGMLDSDFQPDFDHLTKAGHLKLSEWLLNGPMSFLVDDAEKKSSATGAPAPSTVESGR